MGALERVRSNPRLAIAIACGIVLLLAWIAWAIVVTSDHGSRAGLGVLVAWPALLAAAALVSLALIGAFILIRRLASGSSDEAGQLDEQPESEQSQATESS